MSKHCNVCMYVHNYVYTVDWENFVSSKVSKEKVLKGFNFVHLSII